MDAIFDFLGMPILIMLAMAAVVASFLYFGKRGAQIAAAVAALLLAVFAIRKDARRDGEQNRTEEDLKNERTRSDATRRADDAAARVRDGIGADPDSLRDDDGFRRD